MSASSSLVRKKIAALSSLLVLLTTIVFFFGNCSSRHTGQQTSSSSSLTFGNCSLTGPEQLFSLTYSPVLQNKCATCHIPGGVGKGAFASPGLALAFEAFSLVGYKRVSQFAVDPNHRPPYSGAQNAAEINEAEKAWELGVQELASCTNNQVSEFIDDPWKDVRVYSRSKAVNPSATQAVQVRWDLNSEMLPPPSGVTWPNMPGAQFEITLRANVAGSQTNYTISRPRIVYPTSNAGAVDLHAQSIRLKINGQEIINETTFHYIDANARKNQSTLLSAGAMVALSDLRTSDVISFSFGEVRVVTLPPPPPAPTISFVLASQTVNESGRIQVLARLNQSIDAFSTASFSFSGSAQQPCCATILDEGGQQVSVKNFDRDYILPNRDGGTILFEPNITEKMIEIDIESDQRDEANETIVIQLDGFSVGNAQGQLGANRTHTISITDNDAAPGPFEVRFQDLMAAGGAFSRYCVRCHHATSQDVLAREYDMTTYSDLISQQRVVPNNALGSILWRRILGLDGLDPMPQGGLFSPDELQAKDEIYQWIVNGAKNN